MKNMKKLYSFILCILLLFANSRMTISASNQKKEEASFSVRAIIPENQIDKNQTYFDLKMQTGDTQVVQIVITNSSDFAIIAETKIHTATSGNNGSILYASDSNDDVSLVYKMEDIASVEESSIELQAHEEKVVDITLQMPSESFDGVLLGGIIVGAEPKEESEGNTSEGVSLQNKVLYTLGLKLSETENEVEPNLNYIKTQPEALDLQTKFVTYIQNDQAIIMKGAAIESTIYDKDKKNKLYEVVYDNANFAPNSTFGVEVDCNGEKITPGEYVVQMRITYEEHVWEWDEVFTVENEASTNVNENSDINNKVPMFVWIILGVLLLVGFMGLAFYLGRKGRKDDDRARS